MDTTPQGSKGPGKNKRKWSVNEDLSLISALVDMVNSGLYKAENGFKPGYLSHPEQKLQVSLPTAGLKGKPHIESRIKILKRDFGTVFDMLCGPHTSGFGFDPATKCLTADKAVWDTYLQSHPKAGIWKTKPFPFWDELLDVFGKDRARGEHAREPNEMMEEIQKEEAENQENYFEGMTNSEPNDIAASPTLGMNSPTSEEVSTQKKKKQRKSEDNVASMMNGMQSAASVIGNEIAKAAEMFSKSIGVDAMISDKRQQISSELRKMSGLATCDVVNVGYRIARDHDLTEFFFSMNEDERHVLVTSIRDGKI